MFLDSNIIISSLISKTGASYELLSNADHLIIISNYSDKEILRASKRLKRFNLSDTRIHEAIIKIRQVKVPITIAQIKKKYSNFVIDIDDSHVIAGAIYSKSSYLLTYNIKHFKVEKIKEELNIIVTDPGKYLHSLRLN